MDASPDELRALLLIVASSFTAVVAAIVALVRSGRTVQFPDAPAGGGPPARSRRRDHVSVP